MIWSMGFNDGVSHAVSHNALDGDRRKIEYVDATPDFDSVSRFERGFLNQGRPIKPDHVPSRVVRGGKRYGIPDVVWGIGMFFVNDRFREVVERFEPKIHQFLPVDMMWEDGSLAQKMYVLNICNRLDSVDRKETTAELSNGIMWRPDKGGTLVFNLDQIGNHHIWIDKHILFPSGFYISDAFHEALREANITGTEFLHQVSA